MTPRWRRYLHLGAALGLAGLLSACHYYAPRPYVAYQGSYGYSGPGYGHGHGYGYGYRHGYGTVYRYGHRRYRRHHYRGY